MKWLPLLLGFALTASAQVRFFTQTDVRRWPGFGDNVWARATLELHFDVQPRIGQEITVIPLRIPVAPFRMLIRNVEPQQFEGCDEEKIETIYNVEIDDLPNPALRSLPPLPNRRAEFPFDAAVIYPAVPHVRVLVPSELQVRQLPKGVLLSRVTLALALNGDRSPDLLIVTYDDHDLTVEDYYRRTSGIWHLVKHLTPC